MPIDWSIIQRRYVDPYESYHSDKVDRLTSIVAPNGRLILSGLVPTWNSSTILDISAGMVLKDYVLIHYTQPISLDISETRAQAGGNLIVLEYKYEKIYPPMVSKLDIVPISSFVHDSHLILGYVEVNSSIQFVSGSLSTQDPSGTYVREYTSSADWPRNTLRDMNINGAYVFDDDMVVQGNLTVNGTTTTIDSANTAITDNVIVLNQGEGGSGVSSLGSISGLEVERGTLTNAQWIFDESDDSWKGKLIDGTPLHIKVPTSPTDSNHATSKSYVDNHNWTSGDITDWKEAVEDTVGGMVSGNTENGITVTYNDTAGKLNFDVNDFKLTFTGDVTGQGIITNLTDTTISLSVIDNSHEHLYLNNNSGTTYVRTGSSGNIIEFRNSSGTISYISNDGVFHGIATSAYYADLAEKYTIKDSNVNVGDVILISEDENFDCEISNEISSYRVLGVVSENPAFMMNSGLENGTYIALKGRVKCKVKGKVKKGEPLVSYLNGCAVGLYSSSLVKNIDIAGRIFAKALETKDTDDEQLIEVVILS
jgi:hypothetical protein